MSLDTQFGTLCVTEIDGAIRSVDWTTARDPMATPLLERALAQFAAYDAGELTEFDLPIALQVGPLQQAVCDAIAAIPFGDTRTYGEIAQELNVSAQAVGQACGGNPVPILIPCHRVLGAGGKLTGFSGAGGIETKVALLRHEKAGGLLI